MMPLNNIRPESSSFLSTHRMHEVTASAGMGIMTPHSQLRQFNLGSLVALSCTSRPLQKMHVSPAISFCWSRMASLRSRDTEGFSYQALSDRFALPTYTHPIFLPFALAAGSLSTRDGYLTKRSCETVSFQEGECSRPTRFVIPYYASITHREH